MLLLRAFVSGVSPVRFFLPHPSQPFFSKEGKGERGGGWCYKVVGRLHLAGKGAGSAELARIESILRGQVLPPDGQT